MRDELTRVNTGGNGITNITSFNGQFLRLYNVNIKFLDLL
jgi:hypothetical protein